MVMLCIIAGNGLHLDPNWVFAAAPVGFGGVFILRDVQPLLSLRRLYLEQTPEHNGAVLLQTGAGRWVD